MKISDKTETTEITPKESPKDDYRDEKFPCLIMVEGDYLGEVYPITKNLVILGRGADADISFSDSSISRRHAKIEKVDEDYLIYDLGSTNGILVNGKKTREKKLADGNKIKLGRIVLRFGFQDTMDRDYHEKLRSMAIRDGLTKIFNKRHFMEVLKKELAFASRNDVELSLVVFDIDDFKKLNDTYGHTVGDMVLKVLAKILDKEVRGYDIFARFGGEEFIFLLRGISPANTRTFAERIREIVEKHPFVIEDKRVRVTISVGCSFLSPLAKFESPDDFISQADRYLYRAKEMGKNRVCYPKEKEKTSPPRKK